MKPPKSAPVESPYAGDCAAMTAAGAGSFVLDCGERLNPTNGVVEPTAVRSVP